MQDLTIKLQKSDRSSTELIDYRFFFRLYRFYLNLFDSEVINIPYVQLIDGIPICSSLKIDIREVDYTMIVETLFSLESEDNFLGFQIPN